MVREGYHHYYHGYHHYYHGYHHYYHDAGRGILLQGDRRRPGGNLPSRADD
jgi:hypothetical protein